MGKPLEKILLVDDDPGISWALGRFLTRDGFKVATCSDGGDAIELLEKEPFDVVVTDVQMPRVNGLAVVEWVHKNSPKTLTVVMTGFGSQSVRKVSMQKGAFQYIEKPVDPKLLVDLLRSTRTRDTFSGSIADIDLFDYIQMLLICRRQILVEVVSRDGERGRLYIRTGDVIHAQCGGMTGERAFKHCLSFLGGSFASLPWQEPETISIQKQGEMLLLDAAREKDETMRFERNKQSIEKRISELPGSFELDFNLSSIVPDRPQKNHKENQ